MYPVPHKSSISEKRPRVPAWHPSDSDSTWSHDIKSIKTHCGTFTARLPQTSTRLYVKKWLRKTPLKIKFVRKKYNGENGLQRKAILCGGIPGKIKNISDRNTFYN